MSHETLMGIEGSTQKVTCIQFNEPLLCEHSKLTGTSSFIRWQSACLKEDSLYHTKQLIYEYNMVEFLSE